MSHETEINPRIAFTATIQRSSYEKLAQSALRHGLTVDHELNQTIVDRYYLEERIARGAEIVLLYPDGKEHGIRFASGHNPLTEEDVVFSEQVEVEIPPAPRFSLIRNILRR